MSAYDVAVVGLGAMGSATAYAFARRGARTLGLDRFSPPHSFGSSHGETRIIREAYFEDPRYVPMVQRAYDLWSELERAAGQTLMVRTGGLMIGPELGTLVRGARASADTHRLPYEQLTAAELRRRFPVLAPGDDMVGIWEPRAGVLFPEACVAAHLSLAEEAGAELHRDELVHSWHAEDGGFTVVTDRGRYRSKTLVLAANAWLDRLLPGFPITVTRQPLFWFEPLRRAEEFAVGRLPIYLWEPEPDRFFYGFPAFSGEVKVAPHLGGAPSDPDHIDREIHSAEVAAMRARLAQWMPDANGRFLRAVVCMYANTPDSHFVIDQLPEHPGALVISACSGHGFKFSCAIGESAAEILLDGVPSLDLSLFRMRSWT
jgi:sarcosine oxidase